MHIIKVVLSPSMQYANESAIDLIFTCSCQLCAFMWQVLMTVCKCWEFACEITVSTPHETLLASFCFINVTRCICTLSAGCACVYIPLQRSNDFFEQPCKK